MGIPGPAALVRVHVEEHTEIGKIERCPQPEETWLDRRGKWLWVCSANRANAPTPVSCAHRTAGKGAPIAVDFNPASPPAVLRHSRVVHKAAGPDAMGEARFLHRECPA